jgi:hypothetical protein
MRAYNKHHFIARALCNGKTSAFQADDTGSIPVARSNRLQRLKSDRFVVIRRDRLFWFGASFAPNRGRYDRNNFNG